MLIAKPEIQTHKPSTHRFSTRRKAELIACAFVGLAVVSGGIYIVTKQSAIYTQAQLDQIRAEIQDIDAHEKAIKEILLQNNMKIKIAYNAVLEQWCIQVIRPDEEHNLYLPYHQIFSSIKNNEEAQIYLNIDFKSIKTGVQGHYTNHSLHTISEQCTIHTSESDLKQYLSLARLIYLCEYAATSQESIQYSSFIQPDNLLEVFKKLFDIENCIRFIYDKNIKMLLPSDSDTDSD